MNKKIKDLTGQRYGKLTVLSLDEERTKRKSYWVCLCDCGNKKTVRGDSLQDNKTLSCGCLKKEQDKVNLTKNHKGRISKSRLYKIWLGMKSRCNNPNSKTYLRYGSKGVKVCDEWNHNFDNFKEWSLNCGYREDLTIDRINPRGNYHPNNCRWASLKDQANNRTSNVYVKDSGSLLTLTQYAKKNKLSYASLQSKHVRGTLNLEVVKV